MEANLDKLIEMSHLTGFSLIMVNHKEKQRGCPLLDAN